MVLFAQRLGLSLKLPSRLKIHPHHHRQSEPSPAALQSLRSDISARLENLFFNRNPQFLSLVWIRQCLELLSITNRGFAKLLMDSSRDLSEVEADSMEEYLSYSLGLLDLVNCISSSLSHLGQSRVSLSHALTLNPPSSAIPRLNPIRLKSCSKNLRGTLERLNESNVFVGKEGIIHQALVFMKNTGITVCGILISALSGDPIPYSEINKLGDGFVNSSDSSMFDGRKGKTNALEEVEAVNNASASLVAAIAGKNGDGCGAGEAEELFRRLEVLEKHLGGVEEEVDRLFTEVMAGRNELLQSFVRTKQ